MKKKEGEISPAQFNKLATSLKAIPQLFAREKLKKINPIVREKLKKINPISKKIKKAREKLKKINPKSKKIKKVKGKSRSQ